MAIALLLFCGLSPVSAEVALPCGPAFAGLEAATLTANQYLEPREFELWSAINDLLKNQTDPVRFGDLDQINAFSFKEEASAMMDWLEHIQTTHVDPWLKANLAESEVRTKLLEYKQRSIRLTSKIKSAIQNRSLGLSDLQRLYEVYAISTSARHLVLNDFPASEFPGPLDVLESDLDKSYPVDLHYRPEVILPFFDTESSESLRSFNIRSMFGFRRGAIVDMNKQIEYDGGLRRAGSLPFHDLVHAEYWYVGFESTVNSAWLAGRLRRATEGSVVRKKIDTMRSSDRRGSAYYESCLFILDHEKAKDLTDPAALAAVKNWIPSSTSSLRLLQNKKHVGAHLLAIDAEFITDFDEFERHLSTLIEWYDEAPAQNKSTAR